MKIAISKTHKNQMENLDINKELSLESVDRERISPSYDQVGFTPEWWYQFRTPAITADLELELTRGLLNASLSTITDTDISTGEMAKFDEVSEKIRVIVAVSGLLNELDENQLKEFEKSVKRRPLFENE